MISVVDTDYRALFGRIAVSDRQFTASLNRLYYEKF